MGYYPVFLQLGGRRCLVIGGGPVAERKAEGLLEAGALVTVLSPSLSASLEAWAREGRIRHLARRYLPGDLAGWDLAFAATDDGAVNAAVARESREARAWVNAADDPAHCDFILPAVLRRGDLVVAVATGGTSPALSRAIRDELDAYLSEDYARLAEIVGAVRRDVRRREGGTDAEAWRRALDGRLRRLIADGKGEEARAHLRARLRDGACVPAPST